MIKMYIEFHETMSKVNFSTTVFHHERNQVYNIVDDNDMNKTLYYLVCFKLAACLWEKAWIGRNMYLRFPTD